MKINNTTPIRAEDYDNEYSNLIEQLGNTINPFMQQTFELSDGRVDFDNRVENLISVEFTVDADGVPILNNKINTGKTRVRGFQVISAYSAVNAAVTADSQPFISFTPLSGTLVQINKISGLPTNSKMVLNIIVY